jgi:hypothetical protein
VKKFQEVNASSKPLWRRLHNTAFSTPTMDKLQGSKHLQRVLWRHYLKDYVVPDYRAAAGVSRLRRQEWTAIKEIKDENSRGIRNNNQDNLDKGAPWQGLGKPAEARKRPWLAGFWGVVSVAISL